MKARLFILVLILQFLATSKTFAVTKNIRSELSRFTLMKDYVILDRRMKRDEFDSFFSLDIITSSGLKDFVGDISDATSDENDDTQKELNVLEALNRNINTEKYVDIDLAIGIPLPSFKINSYRYTPNLFFGLNLAASISITNNGDVTNPLAQVFLKQDRKFGLNFLIQKNAKAQYKVALYKMTRVDADSSFTAADISDKGKAIDTDDLDTEEITYSTDLSYKKMGEHYYFLGEILELKLMKDSSSTGESKYGQDPLYRLELGQTHKTSSCDFNFFGGVHYRQRYALIEGLYVGTILDFTQRVPLKFYSTLSTNFFTMIAQGDFKYFSFSYTVKLAHKNPQNDMWVPTLHGVEFHIPLP